MALEMKLGIILKIKNIDFVFTYEEGHINGLIDGDFHKYLRKTIVKREPYLRDELAKYD